MWELGMLEARGRIRIKKAFRIWVEEALSRFPINEAALNNEVALASHEVQLSHQDPADRFLSATSLVYDLVLLTVDDRLVKSKGISTRNK
jgi:PIN domain nuclease of toxin-antitoxin system